MKFALIISKFPIIFPNKKRFAQKTLKDFTLYDSITFKQTQNNSLEVKKYENEENDCFKQAQRLFCHDNAGCSRRYGGGEKPCKALLLCGKNEEQGKKGIPHNGRNTFGLRFGEMLFPEGWRDLHMNNLGARLETALELLKSCKNTDTFADIGSDHAFFAIEAKKRGICKRVIASDINKLPLEKGRENAELQGIEAEFVLSDGFDGLEDKEITCAAVCGMGGELIAKMLLRSNIAKKCGLILQPMSAQEELRKTLWENGFEITKEVFVYESKKSYTIMQVEFSNQSTEFDYCDLYLGKERKDSPEFSKYCEKIKNAAEKRRLGLIARNEPTGDIDTLIKKCQMHITSF